MNGRRSTHHCLDWVLVGSVLLSAACGGRTETGTQVSEQGGTLPVGGTTGTNGSTSSVRTSAGGLVGTGGTTGNPVSSNATGGSLTGKGRPPTGGSSSARYVATAIGQAGSHVCAALSDGTILCWGNNGAGELGDGTHTGSTVPIAVSGITNARVVGAGAHQTCAVLRDGTVQCWGAGGGENKGGYGEPPGFALPTSVPGVTDAVAISLGGNTDCALLKDSTLQCWQTIRNWYDLDNSVVGFTTYDVASFSGITNASAISVATYDGYGLHSHTCVVLVNGTVQCWGSNSYGQLGDGTETTSDVPVSAVGITNARDISTGHYHSCALLRSGAIQCWGDKSGGQLGNGIAASNSIPSPVLGITDAVFVASGGSHNCAILSDNSLKCWGSTVTLDENGDPTTSLTFVPVRIAGITNAVAVTTDEYNTCVLLRSGSIQCWGYNGAGQLGNGTTTNSSVPVTVQGF